MILYPFVELQVTVKPRPNSEKTVVYKMAVGEGGARSLDDPIALYDLQTLRRCMHKVNDPKQHKIETVPQYIWCGTDYTS